MYHSEPTKLSKETLYIFMILWIFFLMGYKNVSAEDKGAKPGVQVMASDAMPILGRGEYGTDIDNEDNNYTGNPDGDMDSYIYNTDFNHPIEFNIYIDDIDPSNRTATLNMNIYDVDTNTYAGDPEIDKVYVNGTYVGTLNGSTNTWGVNIFTIPIGTLKVGKNFIRINVDTGNPSPEPWAVNIDWAIIKVAASKTTEISRAWISPVTAKLGHYINAFAEVSDPYHVVSKVEVYLGTKFLFNLTNPDGDYFWSGQFKIPRKWVAGWKGNITIKAKDASGATVARWPGLKVQ